MKYIKFTAFLSCLFFACTNAFAADEVIQIDLTWGSYFGSPSTFYMNKTQQKFCYESTCDTILTQLSELPTSTNPYVGTVVNGFPLIDSSGQILISDYMFNFDITDSIYTAKNLFKSNQNTELHFTGTNAIPSYITMNAATPSWMNPETGNQIFKLAAVPTSPGKKFLAFSTTSNLADDGSLIVIDGYGNILSFAESLSGNISLYALWENVAIICKAGEFLPKQSDKCQVCNIGSWCPGGDFYLSETGDQGTNRCGDGQTSLQGSDSADDCFAPTTVTCLPGEYLPQGASKCSSCLENNWCPGGTFSKSTYNQGANSCSEGMISPYGSSSIDNCRTPATVICSPGQFLPANSTCQVCPDYHWCPGGTYTESYQQAQGINWCGIGLYSSSGSDSADDCKMLETILCNPGNFLKAGATSCSSCLANNWCPGGDFYQSDYEQGLNKCLEGTVCNFGQMEESSCHTPTTITCSAGNYLYYGKCEKCPKDTWCPGGDFTETYTSTEGLNKCSSGETSPEGSDSADDCKMLETINCPAGTWLPAFSSNCNICSKNYW
ncbi:MAG: hypothetical protein WC137_01860, partial [Alphaproteobacteria bacterium]